jgi:hypothetical protein
MLDTSVENETQLNFTAGIGTLDYTSVPLNNGDVEAKVLTPREEFLKRIQNEDPLEGTSWYFRNGVAATGRKRKSQQFSAQQSTTKVRTEKPLCNNSQRIWIALFCCIILEYKGIVFTGFQNCGHGTPTIVRNMSELFTDTM